MRKSRYSSMEAKELALSRRVVASIVSQTLVTRCAHILSVDMSWTIILAWTCFLPDSASLPANCDSPSVNASSPLVDCGCQQASRIRVRMRTEWWKAYRTRFDDFYNIVMQESIYGLVSIGQYRDYQAFDPHSRIYATNRNRSGRHSGRTKEVKFPLTGLHPPNWSIGPI